MAVASCSSEGQPSLRYVLLKGEGDVCGGVCQLVVEGGSGRQAGHEAVRQGKAECKGEQGWYVATRYRH